MWQLIQTSFRIPSLPSFPSVKIPFFPDLLADPIDIAITHGAEGRQVKTTVRQPHRNGQILSSAARPLAKWWKGVQRDEKRPRLNSSFGQF